MTFLDVNELIKIFEEDAEPIAPHTSGRKPTTVADRRKAAAKVANRNINTCRNFWDLEVFGAGDLGKIRKGTYDHRYNNRYGWLGCSAAEDRKIKSDKIRKDEMKAAMLDFMASDNGDLDLSNPDAPTLEEFMTFVKVSQWFDK